MSRNRIKLAAAKRELAKLQERLENRQRNRERGPRLIICFVIDATGCVPDMTDRPLSEWELLKNNPAVVQVDPFQEFALRHQLTAANSGINIVQGEPHFDRQVLPAIPESQKLPFEVFLAWLSTQEKKSDTDEQNRTPHRGL